MPKSSHIRTEVQRHLGNSSGPAPCSSRATHCHLPRTMSRQLSNISKDWECHDLPQTVPVLSHPHNGKVFPNVSQNLLLLSSFLVSTGHKEVQSSRELCPSVLLREGSRKISLFHFLASELNYPSSSNISIIYTLLEISGK